MKFEYEKKNTVTTLRNEIYGINQMMATLEKIVILDFTKLENKVINVKLERFINEQLKSYFRISYGYDNKQKLTCIINNRYNLDTKSYVSFYDTIRIMLGENTTINEMGKETRRFNSKETVTNANDEIKRLSSIKLELEKELENIDSIVNEYKELHQKMVEFKKGKSSFFLDSFKNLNGFF